MEYEGGQKNSEANRIDCRLDKNERKEKSSFPLFLCSACDFNGMSVISFMMQLSRSIDYSSKDKMSVREIRIVKIIRQTNKNKQYL